MSFETKISVPTKDLKKLQSILASAGCIILDTGERTTTEDGVGAEACLNVLFVDAPAAELTVLGVSR